MHVHAIPAFDEDEISWFSGGKQKREIIRFLRPCTRMNDLTCYLLRYFSYLILTPPKYAYKIFKDIDWKVIVLLCV